MRTARTRILVLLVALATLLAGLATVAPALAYDNSQWIPMIGGNPPMVKWAYNQLPTNPGIIFVFQTAQGDVANTFPLNGAVPQNASKLWAGWDNPAPLLWYAEHVDPTWLGWRVFGWGPGPDQHTPLSPQLIATMNAEHFAPSMVGGYDVPGLTAGAPAAPSAAPSPASSSSDAGKPSTTVATPNTARASSPTETARSTKSTASSQPSATASGTAPTATLPSGQPTQSSAPSAAPTVQRPAPASAGPATPPPVRLASPSVAGAPTRPEDPHPPAPRRAFPWPEAAGAVIVAAAGGYGLWRWRLAR